ncbi:MAG: NAD(P)H-hydrate dehydratase [Clostridia bacterium]|nr:NAD(P)H-hydrate dehydratase [Clostridia bacterium]
MLVSSARMRRAEILAESNGLPATTLMENAATAAARYIREQHRPCKVTVVCGSGNYGGDGSLVAADLRAHGYPVRIVLAFDQVRSDAALLALETAQKAGVEVLSFSHDPSAAVSAICEAEILIDAVFGIGYHGALEGSIAQLRGFCNTAHAKKYALDIPSGCDSDTATGDKNAFSADVTLCFGALKPANLIAPARLKCGMTVLLDIGITDDSYGDDNELCHVHLERVRSVFPFADPDTYKNREGRLLVIAGQPGMAGAAKLAVTAATYSGAGLVELMTDRRIAGSISAALTLQLTDFYSTDTRDATAYGAIPADEIRHILAKARKADAVAIGCGWGCGADRAEVIAALLEQTDLPLLLDADALNSLADRSDLLDLGADRLLLTPHMGEFSRLCGTDAAEIAADKLETARAFALQHGVTLLLKGPDTIVTDGTHVNVVTAGSPCMAKGGSGDVLSGVAGAMLAKGLSPLDAATVAAWCCGKAGELAAEKYSVTGATPLDTIDCLRQVYKRIEADA